MVKESKRSEDEVVLYYEPDSGNETLVMLREPLPRALPLIRLATR